MARIVDPRVILVKLLEKKGWDIYTLSAKSGIEIKDLEDFVSGLPLKKTLGVELSVFFKMPITYFNNLEKKHQCEKRNNPRYLF